jgi:hypothetical protein
MVTVVTYAVQIQTEACVLAQYTAESCVAVSFSYSMISIEIQQHIRHRRGD